MTSRKQALEELREKVKAGDREGTKNIVVNNAEFFPTAAWLEVGRAFDGSLDAAKALHEAVLPDWSWQVPHTNNFHLYRDDLKQYSCGYNNNPARSWVLAILSALIAQEGE